MSLLSVSMKQSVFLFCFAILTSSISAALNIDFLGYDTFAQGTLIDGVNTDEISGITYNSETNTYFAISDNLIATKGFIEMDFTFNTNISFDLLAGHQMTRSDEKSLTGMDSESIAFIANPTNPDNSYLIVGQEGHVTYNAENELYLYFTNGSYIRTMTDELDTKFLIANTDNNRGLEALTVDLQQQYAVYSSETPLKSDQSFCTNCNRISVNMFSVDGTLNEVSLTQQYQVRYDLDTFDFTGWSSDGSFSGLTDMAVFGGVCDELYGIVVERAVYDNNPIFNFDTRLYLVELSAEQNDDVAQCESLGDVACQDIVSVEKTLLFSFDADYIDDTATVQHMLYFGQFEALSIVYNDDGSLYDDEYMMNLVMLTDNAEIAPTTVAYLQLDVSSLFENVDCDMSTTDMYEPSTTMGEEEESAGGQIMVSSISIALVLMNIGGIWL